MSKQYSEHLSESVTRGVTTNFEQGKSSAYKWGYSRDEVTGRYEPDNNFELIKSGWQMRLEGHTARGSRFLAAKWCTPYDKNNS